VKYLLSIYGDETGLERVTPEDMQQILQAYDAFTREVKQSGAFLAGEGLQPTSAATTVRIRDGERLVTDGPFAETKEQLGGFYLLECENLDEAIELAAKIPGARHGSIEVRPVMNYEAPDQTPAGAGAEAQRAR
jgi:hypothetical protein